jgi:type I site-specific restriction-modification system R (restriction) subunit
LLTPQVFNLTHLIEYFYGVTWNTERKGVFNWRHDFAAAKAGGRTGGYVQTDAAPLATSDGEKAGETFPLAAEDGGGAHPSGYGEHVRTFFDRERFLTLLREWILFFTKDDELKKTVLRQHQTRAVEKVVARCRDPQKTRGLVWHTQGSGKTFTMITAARLLLAGQSTETAPTVLLVVDRNELEGQLAGWVERLLGEISQAGIAVEKAYRRERLRELLAAGFRGLIITMIHKFDGMPARITTRKDFFVLIDEAHRSTGGDLGNYLMGALPAAEKSVRKEFPKPLTQPKILIVTDKLLTGYDAPILYCMYLDKPMRDHVLLQAVARVNRPYEDARGVEKPCGLIIDFVGILKDLKKALAFDCEDYTGVIEGLDVLLVRFRELMDGPALRYLPKSSGKDRDVQLEKLLYETLFRKEAREVFTELFKEIETLYEILSPDSALADDIEPYNCLADLYAMMQVAYGQTTSFVGELANKTAALVQRNAAAHGLDRLTKTVEFDEAALAALRVRKGPDEEKVIDLVRSLQKDGESKQKPHLISIAERAAGVMEALDERQASTQQALEQLEALMGERLEAERARAASGLEAGAFGVFWELKREGYDEVKARALAVEIETAYGCFPNADANADELRQLKAESYKVLLKVVSGAKMIALAETVMRARPS